MTLFAEERNCCGCGTCSIICPKSAIKMVENQSGFLYPKVDESTCISCGVCHKVCAFQNIQETNVPQKVYAIARKNRELLKKSASGGVFAGFAEAVIQHGGVVYGAALLQKQGTLVPCHIAATSQEELERLYGSKYVQSSLNDSFRLVKQQLDAGRYVLFSGTPCQIAALKAYLCGDYENLLTIDIVCHGVPSAKMFQDYIQVLNKKLSGTIETFCFRDKISGGIYTATVGFRTKHKEIKRKTFPSNQSSYYELFLQSEICRESCYHCPYASQHHPADLTIGDFWGIDEEHPEFLEPTGKLNANLGVSMLMVNTQKGADEFEKVQNEFIYEVSSFEAVARHNEQLNHPSIQGEHRDEILKLYQKKGFSAIDQQFKARKRKERQIESVKYHLHHDIPEPLRKAAKRILRRK